MAVTTPVARKAASTHPAHIRALSPTSPKHSPRISPSITLMPCIVEDDAELTIIISDIKRLHTPRYNPKPAWATLDTIVDED